MNDFEQYVNQIQVLRETKAFDKAWSLSNSALIELRNNGNDSWYMVYYQMAMILADEGKWEKALLHLGLMLKELKRVGGAGQTKFINKVLKKMNMKDCFSDFVTMSCNAKDAISLQKQLSELIEKK